MLESFDNYADETSLNTIRLDHDESAFLMYGSLDFLDLFGVGTQTEEHLGTLSEGLLSEVGVGELLEVGNAERIDGLAFLGSVDFDALVFALEEFNSRKSLSLESIKSQFHALNVIVTSS